MTVNTSYGSPLSKAFDGSTTAFPLTGLQFLAASDLVVTFLDAGAQVYAKVLGDDYTITGDGTAASGTLNVALPKQTGFVSARIERATARKQDVQFVAGSGAPAAAQERQEDRVVLVLQELDKRIDVLAAAEFVGDLATAQLGAQRAEAADTDAQAAKTAAQGYSGASATSATSAGISAAVAIAMAGGLYASTADALSNGVAGTASLVAGSGGTNGQFDVAFSGGGGTGAAARFVVAGGALVSIVVTSSGANYTSAPTMSFAASSGLTGASATAVIGVNVPAGPDAYFAVAQSGNTMAKIYRNVIGTGAVDQNIPVPTATAYNDLDTRALLAGLPRGPIGVWAFDRFAASSIPNLLGGSSNIAVSSGSLAAGVFTGQGTITFPAAQTMTRWTVMCLVQVTALATYNVILADQANFNNFTFRSVSSTSGAATTGGGPGSPKNADVFQVGINPNLQGQRGGLFNLPGRGYHVLTMCQSADGLAYWLDDIELWNGLGVDVGAITFTNLLFGVSGEPVQASHQYAGFLALWDRGLSDAEIRQAVYQERARVAPQAIVPNGRANRILIAEGDSNHGPHNEDCWIWKYGPNDSPEVFGGSYAIAGNTIGNVSSRAALVDSIIPPDTYGRKFILTVGVGTNDLPNLNSTTLTSTFIPALRSYMMARKTAGWTLALFTVPRRGDLAGAAATSFETLRTTLNADILANPTLYGLAGAGQVIDIGSAVGIGSTFDATKYTADLLHFSATGGAQVEALARPVINAL